MIELRLQVGRIGLEKLDTILALQTPLSPAGIAALEDLKRQEVLAQQATDLVKDELDVRKNVRDTVWVENLRDKFGDKAVSIYTNYQIFKDVKSVYDAGAGWINSIKDPDTAATEKIKKDSLGAAGTKTPENIAKDAVGYINIIATHSAVFHYAYYREIYDPLINPDDDSKPKTPDEAHKIAMDALRERVDEGPGDSNNQMEQKAWGPAAYYALKSNGIYDNAFRILVKNNVDPPKV